MRLANFLGMALGLVLAAIGVLGFTAPSVIVEFGRSLQTAGGLWVVAAVRIAFGVILLLAAADSRTPVLLRIIGVLLIIAGVVTPFLGVDKAKGMFDWWTSQGSFLARAWPGAAILFGLLIAYVTMPKGSGM